MVQEWKRVWREGLAKVLPLDGLKSLLVALETDDPRLHQGATTTPPPLMCVQDWPCEGACVIGWTKFRGDGAVTVGEVEQAFARACDESDRATGDIADVKWFLNWFDDTPRDRMRAELIPEVRAAIEAREQVEVLS